MNEATKRSIDEDCLLYHDEPDMTLREALSNRKLWKITIYGMLIAFSFRLPAIIMPIVGAKYFGSDDGDDNNDTKGCNSKGNATYAMWFSAASCIGGVFGFVFESYLGRIADAYGRKKIMYFTWFLLFMGNASMCLTNNVWFYLILFPLSSLAGLFSGIPTVLSSALSDCVIPKHKTTIFAILFGLAGFVSILGSAVAALLTSYISFRAPFFAFAITMFIALLWLIFVVEETLSVELRVAMTGNNRTTLSPLAPLWHICDNGVILWVSIMALITAIPESGIDDMIGSYTDDILSLCDNDTATAQFNAISGISMGIVMLMSQFLLLPILSKYFSDIFLFIFVLFAVLSFMLSGIIAYLWPSYITGILIWGCFGLSFITSPVTNGCLAKRLNPKQQGLGMGILHSMKGLTFAVAPYAFGGLYDLFHNKGILKTMPFMFGIIFVLFGIIILFGPLKRTLNQYDDSKLRNGLVPVAETHIVQHQ